MDTRTEPVGPLDTPLSPRVAVLIPCYNEAGAIGKVVADFRDILPGAAIFVYDNNSRDDTAPIARKAGAVVRREPMRGKGHVVRRMFADIDADVYILVDGDDTYDASSAPDMISLLVRNRLDMVTGIRVSDTATVYRRGHRFGNRMLTGLVKTIFGRGVSDMLSGYRAFSRRFVKSFPCLATGFEVETEFTVHALEMQMPIDEIPTSYKDRAPDTESKLRTYADGVRILRMIARLMKQERPLQLFGFSGTMMLLLGVGLGTPVMLEFLQTGLVPRLPTALLATGCVLVAFLGFATGLILDAITHGRMEMKRLSYLRIPPFNEVGAHARSVSPRQHDTQESRPRADRAGLHPIRQRVD